MGSRSSPRSLRGAVCFHVPTEFQWETCESGTGLVGETYVVKVYGNPEVSCMNNIAVRSDFSTTKSKFIHQVIQYISMRN